jgi:hypothetical protein
MGNSSTDVRKKRIMSEREGKKDTRKKKKKLGVMKKERYNTRMRSLRERKNSKAGVRRYELKDIQERQVWENARKNNTGKRR